MEEPKKPDLQEIIEELERTTPFPYDGDSEAERNRAIREEARRIKRERDAEYEWKYEHWKSDERQAEIYKTQPTLAAFEYELRQDLLTEIKRRNLKPHLLDQFIFQAGALYEVQLFRRFWDAEEAVRRHVETMATKGPRLLHEALVKIFCAYASTPQGDFQSIIESPVYKQHHIRLQPLDLPHIPMPEVAVDPELAFSGTWIVSPQGMGKTTLLRKLVLDHMDEPCSIIIIDRKGELAEPFRTRKFPKEVVTIDPHNRLALNVFDLGTHSLATLMQVYDTLLGAGVTPLQGVLLRHAVYLCTHIPNATLGTLRDIMVHGVQKHADAVEQIEDDEERDFWISDFPTNTYAKTRQELLWRINVLRPPGSIIRGMFDAPQTKLKLAPLMDSNTITIINNSQTLLDDFQGEFFSRLFLTMILGAAEQRASKPQSQKLPCYLFLDEADTAIRRATELAEIIYRCRSQRIAATIAHQSLSQIEEKRVQSALADCAIIYANNKNDAHALAPKLHIPAETLSSLGIGEFALALRGQQTQTVKIPLPDFSPYPLLSQAEIGARNADMALRYHYTPERKKLDLPAAPPLGDVPIDDQPKPWGDKPVL